MNIEVLRWVLALIFLGGNVMEAYTNITKQSFGKTPEGVAVDLYTLKNRNGVEAAITNYGGIVVQLRVPDRKGNLADIVLGYDDLDGYVHDKAYLGALIGRYGNRIAHGKFSLDGKVYTLPLNNGDNTLHGGLKGFNRAIWRATEVESKDGPSLQLEYLEQRRGGRLSGKPVGEGHLYADRCERTQN